jgi:hypothetical protein
MELSGHVQNGVIVLDDSVSLPEGAAVVVTYVETQANSVCNQAKRVELPLVSSGEPGSIHLTNERIYEILDSEDIEAMKSTWNAPS